MTSPSNTLPTDPTHSPAAAPGAALSDLAFLTVAEVASVMRVSKMTVYRLVHSAELPSIRVGRSFRVPESAARAYLSRQLVSEAQ